MNRLEELIDKARSGDQGAKSALVEENSGLIWSIARRFIGRGVETEDLYQLGCLGFLKAVDGFDLEYGTQFSTYAVPKISGEIRRFLRDDGAVKVSRGVKERAFAIRSAQSEFMNTFGREPTLSELSQTTGFSPEDIAAAQSATAAVESIHQETGANGFSLENVLTDTQSEADMVEKISLRQAVDALAERESMVIRLRYYHGLTQDKVSQIMSVSQVQVSRIEKKALQKLKQLMSD